MIGVIGPGAREAVSATRNGRIGVIGTNATISSGAYEAAVNKIDKKLKVYTASCPLFVPLAEEGWVDKKVAQDIAEIYLKPLKAKKIDTLVLGCTHYPLLKNVIKKVIGAKVSLVDSATEVAKEAKELLDASGLLNKSQSPGSHKFFSSDEPARFIKMGEHFLRRRIDCVKRKD